MTVLNSLYAVKMPDGSKWAIPVIAIAENHALHYMSEFSGDFTESLNSTAKLFNEDQSKISDWAKNNMNWSDVVERMNMIEPPAINYEDGWDNGGTEII